MEVHVVARRDTETGIIRAMKHLHSPEPEWKHAQSADDFWTLFSCHDENSRVQQKEKCRYWNLEGKQLTKWGWKEPCWRGQHFWRLMTGMEVAAIPWRYLRTSHTTCHLHDTIFITAFLIPHFQLFVSLAITPNGILYRTVPSTNTRLYE